MKKKESGAEGRKKRKLVAEQTKKSNEFFTTFLEKHKASNSICLAEPPAPTARLLESKGEPGTNASQAEEELKSDKSEYNKVKNKAARENVDIIEGKNYDVCINEIELNDTESSNLNDVNKPQTVIPEVIKQHDIGLLKFDKNTGKAILSDALRTEIIKLGSKYFQNSEGPFRPTNNRSMNKTWFMRKLGNGLGEKVIRSWLVYSPSKNSAFCICCLFLSRSNHQSTLEQENGFSQWKAPERISVHENAKNHRECFTQWKEMERNLAENTGIIDVELQSQIEKEKRKWRDILRVLHCIKFLATQNSLCEDTGSHFS